VISIAWHYITADVSNSILAHAGLRVHGGTIFGRGRNTVESLAISTFLTAVTGVFMTQMINLIQLTISFFVMLLRKDTGGPLQDEGWGHLMDRPWAATSLHDFWGCRWHQALRLQFLYLGGYPLKATLNAITSRLPLRPKSKAFWVKTMSDAGLVCGSFFASAAIHNYSISPNMDPVTGLVPNASAVMGAPTLWFFSLQGLGLGIERVYKLKKGKAVSGIAGRLWVYVWIIGGGQMLWNSWHNRRFQPGLVISPDISVTEKFIIPLLKQYL